MASRLNVFQCPNCSHFSTLDLESGFSCKKCFATYTPEEFVSARFSKMFKFLKTGENTTALNFQGTEVGSFSIVRKEICIRAKRQVVFSPVINFLANLGARVVLGVSGVDPYPSQCQICGHGLSFENHRFNELSIGCHNKNHTYNYEDPLDWLASILSHQYPKVTFTVYNDTEGIKVSFVQPVPVEKPTGIYRFFNTQQAPTNKIVELTQRINVATSSETLAVWIPKKVQAEIGDVIDWLNTLRVKKVKVILVND